MTGQEEERPELSYLSAQGIAWIQNTLDLSSTLQPLLFTKRCG